MKAVYIGSVAQYGDRNPPYHWGSADEPQTPAKFDMYALSKIRSEEIFAADIENCINDNPYLEGYIIENAGQLQGYGMVAKSFSTEFGKPCIWIEDIYVKNAYRGLGIGSLFLKFIESKYPSSILRLEVEEENDRAVNVYKKCGYEVIPYMEMKK